MSLGENIVIFRKEKGITQTEIAERIGVQSSFISRIEKGRKTPSVARLIDIADILDCSIDRLLDRNKKN